MKNYKIIVQYDGTNFAGWQIQNNAPTIQQIITDSIQILLKEKINLIGSGRTDSGVHALGQVANFISEKEFDKYKFLHSLNAILPAQIAVKSVSEVPLEFHARYSAVRRSYIYLFSKFKNPFFNNFASRLYRIIAISKLNELSRAFLGEKDFSSFTKKIDDINNRICTISDIHWRENKELIIFYIEANRFLHGMVRAIGGTLLKAEAENKNRNFIEDIFLLKNRQAAGESVPAKGLFLFKVKY